MISLPFSAEEFFGVFRAYNLGVWPAQVLLLLAALGIIVLAFRRHPWADRALAGLLGGLWIWAGLVYHISFFSGINPAAYLFGFAFVVQGLLIIAMGARRTAVRFRPRNTVQGLTGGAIVLYALVLYPVLGIALHHEFPASPTFGVPCPTTLFTFGVLLWVEPRAPRVLLWIPVAWALIGSTAVSAFGMREDAALFIAAVVTIAMSLSQRSTPSSAAAREGYA